VVCSMANPACTFPVAATIATSRIVGGKRPLIPCLPQIASAIDLFAFAGQAERAGSDRMKISAQEPV